MIELRDQVDAGRIDREPFGRRRTLQLVLLVGGMFARHREGGAIHGRDGDAVEPRRFDIHHPGLQPVGDIAMRSEDGAGEIALIVARMAHEQTGRALRIVQFGAVAGDDARRAHGRRDR